MHHLRKFSIIYILNLSLTLLLTACASVPVEEYLDDPASLDRPNIVTRYASPHEFIPLKTYAIDLRLRTLVDAEFQQAMLELKKGKASAIYTLTNSKKLSIVNFPSNYKSKGLTGRYNFHTFPADKTVSLLSSRKSVLATTKLNSNYEFGFYIPKNQKFYLKISGKTYGPYSQNQTAKISQQ